MILEAGSGIPWKDYPDWLAYPFANAGPGNPVVLVRGEYVKTRQAVRRVIADWDGENWEAVRAVLRRDGLTDTQIAEMNVSAIRQHFAISQKKIILNLGGKPHTADATIIDDAATMTSSEGDKKQDLILMRIALERFKVSRPTLKRDKTLKDYRPPNAPANAERIFSESELARKYERRR